MAHDTKDNILNAANKLFSKQGYDGCNVDLIADRAIVNKATIRRKLRIGLASRNRNNKGKHYVIGRSQKWNIYPGSYRLFSYRMPNK